MIRESFTLILMTFLALTMDRVNVHVARQEIKGLTEQQCKEAVKEAMKEGAKARCVRENLSVLKGRE